MTKNVTVDDVMFWKPCSNYPRARVVELFAGRESLGWREIVALNLPDVDLLWVFLRSEFLSERRQHLLACDFAYRVLYLIPSSHRAITEKVIYIKRLWENKLVTDEELAVSRATWAAWDVASLVTWDVASLAARDAAWAAMQNAVWEAARAARLSTEATTEKVTVFGEWSTERVARVAEITIQLALVLAALEEENA